jgi:hypothetical protein
MLTIWCEKGQGQAECAAQAAAYQRQYWLKDWGTLDAVMNTIMHKPFPLFCCLTALVCLAACVNTARSKRHRYLPKVPVTYGAITLTLLAMAPTINYF